ncbi:Cytochrome P450 71D18 [Hibiscus syriacus]|uniref:Cytochrome P450 71D18 n=1 Tax=Hibiscus syriacus TaxID=106335 RepID=A0A6A2XU77_HIBSY|nr:Cytochrome P450 71D18 [Hibiscus syriacus]
MLPRLGGYLRWRGRNVIDFRRMGHVGNGEKSEGAKKGTKRRQVCHGKGDVDEARLKELKYLSLVIKETFRLHPPFPLLLPRESRVDCEVNGYQVPCKTKIIINAWAIARDPKHWNEPETFYPERFLNNSIDFKGTDLEFIPFGAGRRMCPGISFALPNVELPLAKLLFHFDWEHPSGMNHQNLDMTEIFGVTMRRKDDLILIPTPFIC